MKFWSQRKLLFLVLFLVSVFIIFFVGRKYDSSTGQRHMTLTLSGVNHFRKGLDVSGGTKLVYKIAYDKYEKIYEDKAELDAIKKTIETIILKNIDKRISKLGVSDYRSYTQSIKGETYIVVELGGIADLDQAKELIGKTVELEFKLPNKKDSSAQELAKRKVMAQKLLSDISTNPTMMKKLTEGRSSENVFYNMFTGVKLSELPQIYQDNIEILNTLKLNTVYPGLLEGTYAVVPQQTQDGKYEIITLEGFAAFQLLDKKTVQKTGVNAQDIANTSKLLGLKYKQDFVKTVSIASGKYELNGTTLVFNAGEIAQGKNAYETRVYTISKPSSFGTTGNINPTQDKEVEQRLSLLKAAAQNSGSIKDISGANMVTNGRLDEDTIKKVIPNFKDQAVNSVESYDNLGTYYVIYVGQKKSGSEKIFNTMTVSDINSDQWKKFDKSLKEETFYTIQDVYVQDKETWLPALDVEKRMLNGAFFKFANFGRDDAGQPVVIINLDDSGKDIFCSITENNIGEQMAIFVGGEMKTAPKINSKICGGTAQIEGGFSMDDAKKLVDDLNEGTLPAPLVLMQEEKISPTLGADAMSGALIAGAVCLFGILLYMWYLYGFKKATITFFVLVIFLSMLAAFMKMIDYALSLSGIAAIILSIGMGVDVNVLMFERIKEELADGKTMSSAIETSYKRSRAPIRDGNISTALIGLLLFTGGNNMFKGFGAMLILNNIMMLFINYPLTRDILDITFKTKKSIKA